MQSDRMLMSGDEAVALAAIRGNLPEKLHDMNLNAFREGRETAARWRP